MPTLAMSLRARTVLLTFVVLSSCQPVAGLEAPNQKPSTATTAQHGSVFTVDIGRSVRPGQGVSKPNDPSYDLAVIEFEDDGRVRDPSQLPAAAAAIDRARRNPNGAIVVAFIHGWHHNAAWDIASDNGDSHFRAFRQVLTFIALRETERYFGLAGGRRVVGVYLGWNGDPRDSWLTEAGALTHLSFWDRYAAAKRIGAGEQIRAVVRTIVQRTKGPLTTQGELLPAIESPLILIGHSMGALMLESAFLSLIKDPSDPLVLPAHDTTRPMGVRRGGERILFPDVLIALNSAADSAIHHEIRQTLSAAQYTKSVGDRQVGYAGPLLISATSKADNDTKVVWRAANIIYPGRTTDGHDKSLFTHELVPGRPGVTCMPRDMPDRGQNWHCLRLPEPQSSATPAIAIDLPTRDRQGIGDIPPFTRYQLVPLMGTNEAHLTWVFQIPPEVVADHNDIFNSRASSLMLALIQISGAIMSLAQDWGTTFEGPAN